MHYTSVPNILKVLDPLFLDDLVSKLEDAGQNTRKLLNLRNRMSRIRVFDPACGSGNFLVIAYKQMRAIEAKINDRRDEVGRRSDIPLTNFRGIELRDFPAAIARLALIIAEYQADVLYRGQKLALTEFLPLDQENWITCGNALRLDWLSICPPSAKAVKLIGDDLFQTPLDQAQIDFENEGGETYICGNPPYAGLSSQKPEQKVDLELLFQDVSKYWKSFDYVCGWIWKAASFLKITDGKSAFVTTNSVCQGQQVPMFWPLILCEGLRIDFAHASFKWTNLATKNAAVTVIIVGLGRKSSTKPVLFSKSDKGEPLAAVVENINAYLAPAWNTYVVPQSKAPPDRPTMHWGCTPTDGGHLIISTEESVSLIQSDPGTRAYIRPYYGSTEYIKGAPRKCIWVEAGGAEARVTKH